MAMIGYLIACGVLILFFIGRSQRPR